MAFWDELEEKDKKGIFKSDMNTVSYATGFTALDYANGYWQTITNDKGEKIQVPMIGIPDGSLISIIGSTGTGKALPDHTRIPTPDGRWTYMKNLKVGDMIIGSNGEPVQVIGVYPQKEECAHYVLHFEDGRSMSCSPDHLWTVYRGLNALEPEVERTEDLISVGKVGENGLHEPLFDYYIPLVKPIEYAPTKEALDMVEEIDAWSVGYAFATIEVDTFDGILVHVRDGVEGIPDGLRMFLKKTGWSVKYNKDKECYYLTKSFLSRIMQNFGREEIFTDLFTKNGPCYDTLISLFSKMPLHERWKLIHGFFEGIHEQSDQWPVRTDTEYVEFTIPYDTEYVKGIITILNSLGVKAIIKDDKIDGEHVKRFRIYPTEYFIANLMGHVYYDGEDYDLNIFTSLGAGIVVDPRKGSHSAYTEVITNINTKLRLIGIEILPVKTKMTCIRVKAKDQLFVAGDELIVTHNTTFALQVGWNIIKKFENGMLFHFDCEQTTQIQRTLNLLKMNELDPRYKQYQHNASIEDALNVFKQVCEMKEAGGKKYMYEVTTSYDGKPFWIYEPTVFIVDSLPSFNSKEYNTEDLGGNIDQMKAAKDITRFYTNILANSKKYNCIWIAINHIRPNSIMNPYAAPPRGLMMINPQSETLPRGMVPQYYSNTYFRINSKKSAAYTEDDWGFKGYKCEIVLAKSKTNSVGTSFPITFNTSQGFDPIISLYEFADANGLINGRNPYLYITGLDDFKFNRRDFRDKMIKDKEFYRSVLTVLKPYYEALLGEKPDIEKDPEEIALENPDIDLSDL